MIQALRAAEAAAGSDPAAVSRHLHTLKGDAQMLGFDALVAEAQALEALIGTDLPALRAGLAALRAHALEICAEPTAPAITALAFAQDKVVRAKVDGSPRILPEHLAEPVRAALVHLVRNALAHGIAQRGHLTITYAETPQFYRVSCHDDGGGFDTAALRRRAVALGAVDAAAELSREQLLDLAFVPKLSTAATPLSGQGIGLDAVRAAISAVGGTVRIASEPGNTSVTLHLPKAGA